MVESSRAVEPWREAVRAETLRGRLEKATAESKQHAITSEDLSRAKQVIAESRWVGRSVDWDEVDVGEMPPDVARIMARTRRDRWVQRAVMAVAWLALLVVVGSIALGLLRAIVR